ncbi:uncharacterized protein [Haliotis cracherodii]|uniref:uncharacterized protein n=1 Tax=Haliotis cracherodii TaxID=6455 RepID=UPI0039E893BD
MEREAYPAYKVFFSERPMDQGYPQHQESYHLVIHEEALQLRHLVSGDVILELPYKHIRKYIVTPNTFSIEAGRMCMLGEGEFQMETCEARSIMDKINKRKKILKERRARIQDSPRKNGVNNKPYSPETCGSGITEHVAGDEYVEMSNNVNNDRSSPTQDADGVTVVKLTAASHQHVDEKDTGLYLSATFSPFCDDYVQLQSNVTETASHSKQAMRPDSSIYLSAIHEAPCDLDKTTTGGQSTDVTQKKVPRSRKPVPQMAKKRDVPPHINSRLQTIIEGSDTRAHLSPTIVPRQRVDRYDPKGQYLSPPVPPRRDHTRLETYRGTKDLSQTQDQGQRATEDTDGLYLTPTLRERHQENTQRLPLSMSPVQRFDRQECSSPTFKDANRDIAPSLGRTTDQHNGRVKCVPLSSARLPRKYFIDVESNDSGTDSHVSVNIHSS